MSLSSSSLPFNPFSSSTKFEVGSLNSRSLCICMSSKDFSKARIDQRSRRQVWRRRKLCTQHVGMEHSNYVVRSSYFLHLHDMRWLVNIIFLTKKDEYMDAKLERVPFLEEQVRKINEGGGILAGDIDRLLKSEDNRFEFVNGIAAEAKAYVDNNRDEYGAKKAILHVLSNRMNEAGFSRPEAYMETDPFVPGPTFLKEEFT